MTDPSHFKRLNPEIETGVADMIQALFDGTISESETEELLKYWDQLPDIASALQANCFVEQILQLHDAFHATLSSEQLEKLKSAARKTFAAESSSGDVPDSSQGGVTDIFGSLDLDMLAALAAQSPSLPRQEGGIETPITKTQSAPLMKIEPKTGKKESFLLLKWLIPLCLFLLVLAVYREFYPTDSRDTDSFVAVARIVESVEAVWEDGTKTFKSGQELTPSRLRLRSGVVKLEFGNGTTLVLEGPTEFLVKDRDRGFCQTGKLSAHVPPQGIGFRIDTPIGSLVDLGTEFFMDVSEEKFDAHVLAGKVETQRSPKEKQPLLQGNAVKFSLNGKLETFAADPLLFFSESKLEKVKEDYTARRKDVWDAQTERMQSDPSLLYRLETKKATQLPQTRGSRAGKTAVRFQNRRERLPVSVPGEHRSLTLIVSARVDKLTEFSNTLMMGDAFNARAGEFHWQLNRFGALQFHLNYGNLDIRKFDSPTVFHRKDYRTWINLAIVADAERKKITHYFDGEPVASVPWDRPIPIRLDQSTIGNEQAGTKKPTARFFNGSMEDFWIFSRPFDAEEIKDFYRNNN